MAIKARPFKTLVGNVEVEGYFEGDSFVFSFYGLVAFRPPVMSMGEDAHGRFAVLQETEIPHPDGYMLLVETHYDSHLGTEWGYQVSLRRDDTEDRNLLRDYLKEKGLDPESAILITPPKQLTSVFFDPHGVIDGSAYLPEGGQHEDQEANLLVEGVRSSAARRVLFLSHALRQMSRPDRMITTKEVRGLIAKGVVIEHYTNDPRGASCLLMGRGSGGRPVHVVCSPKPEYLAIITAYLPNPNDWSGDFTVRLKR